MLNNFFNPKSIAIIGASSDENKVGYALMKNVSNGNAPEHAGGETNEMGVTGETGGTGEIRKREIYPVTLNEENVLGLKAYKSIKEIESSVDLAVIAVRADIVPKVLKECGEKKVPAAIIISAGFREIGEAGKKLEEECANIASENNILLLGPNCLGIIDSHSNLNASFAAQKPKKGNTAFLSQSGALGTAILDFALKEGVGFAKFISLGNEAVLTEIEFLRFLRDDPETSAILIYLEKLTDGAEFMKLVAEISKSKPVVVLKAGRSARGERAVMSHTGSLAPDGRIFSAACRQAGAIVVESIREFVNMAKLFELGILQPIRNFVILTNGGGPSVVAADLVDLSKHLSLVELSGSVMGELKKVLPPMAAVGNPIDIIGDALSARYRDALDILTEESIRSADDNHLPVAAKNKIDGIIFILTPQMMTEVAATAELVAEYRKKIPIIPVFMGGPAIETGLKIFRENGIVNFAFPKDAIEALDNLGGSLGMKVKIMENIRKAQNNDVKMMEYEKMEKILMENKIKLSGMLLSSKSDLIKAISKIGKGPYAMKAISEDIVHKTDAGVVKLNISGMEEAGRAWDEISEKVKVNFPGAVIQGIVVQEMGRGKETIIGMKRDPVFGPTIVFGLGGIFTEILRDTAVRVAPVTEKMAIEMIHEIKAAEILLGARGEKGVDLESLAKIIVGVSDMAIRNPQIKEIDLNPVMATESGVVVVDARVMV